MKKQTYAAADFITATLQSLLPPETLTVSQWAERYRVLDSRSSAIPGRWSNEVTPYLTAIMDEFNNPESEEIALAKPTQVGGTEALNNMLAYAVAQDPGPALVVYPTLDLAKSVSENRLQPMIRMSAPLREKHMQRESDMLELQFHDGFIGLTGANSVSGLSSRPIRYLFLDEVDKYPTSTRTEASPIKLAIERTKTFDNRKVFMTSTPTVRGGHIWQAMEAADVVKHFFVPCPHCGEFMELKFTNIRWPKEPGMTYSDRAEFAHYGCEHAYPYVLAHPAAHSTYTYIPGILPPLFMQPEEVESIPFIRVSPGEGRDNHDSGSLTVQLDLVIWNPGLHLDEAVDRQRTGLLLNDYGWRDLANGLDYLRRQLQSIDYIGGLRMEYPVRYSMLNADGDGNPTHPYFRGYVAFDVTYALQRYKKTYDDLL